jgi:hypothetical protein
LLLFEEQNDQCSHIMSSRKAKEMQEWFVSEIGKPGNNFKSTDRLLPLLIHTDGVCPVKGALSRKVEAMTLLLGWFSPQLLRQTWSMIPMGSLDNRLARGSMPETSIIEMLIEHGEGMDDTQENYRNARAKAWISDFKRRIHAVRPASNSPIDLRALISSCVLLCPYTTHILQSRHPSRLFAKSSITTSPTAS